MQMTGAELVSRIIYQDEAMLVIDKPYGIAVHRGPKGGVTLDDFLPDLQFGYPDLPQLAHRLDRETTGCLVLGRTKAALKRLGGLFATGRVQKTYLALLCGTPREPSGRIDLALMRKSHDKRSWWMKVDPAGDPSVTRYQVMAEADGLALVAFSPETGRTHQLRVHSAALGCPIAGDRVYGGDRAMAVSPGLMLHASRVVIPTGSAGTSICVTAPLPDAMSQFLIAIGLGDAVTRIARDGPDRPE